MIEIPAVDFDLPTTLNSGQVFHWQNAAKGFVGMIGDHAVYVEQDNDVLRVRDGEVPSSARQARPVPGIIAHYFALDHPLTDIWASFPDDPVMNAARDFCRGLRIIRQPKWECLATFICSSMKQVAHIRQISLALRNRFGRQRKIGSRVLYSFPSPQRIGRASEDQLRECKLGYRAKHLLATARLVTSTEADLDSWSTLSDARLREKLCALPGVGSKIANCVMLFAYERLRAFPIDVWIERVLREQYMSHRKKITVQQLLEFAGNYFGKYGGYAQQYLFHHARLGIRLARARRKNRRRIES